MNNWDFKRAIRAARRTDTPRKVLRALAKHESVVIKTWVAKNPITPKDTLIELAKTDDPKVLRQVADHFKTPPDVLASLAFHPDHKVRQAVASHPSTPRKTLIQMADTFRDPKIIECIFSNLNTPISVINKFLEDRSSDIEIWKLALQQWRFRVLLGVDKIDKPAAELVRDLAYAEDSDVRREYAASHPLTPPVLLDCLSVDVLSVVRRVALNIRTPVKTLESLAHHSHSSVRAAVAANRATHPSTLDKLSYDPIGGVRCAVASNEFTPPEILNRLAEDSYYFVRANALEMLETYNETEYIPDDIPPLPEPENSNA